MDRADVHHVDLDRRESVFRDARELQEDGDCDRGEPHHRVNSVEDLFWEVADSRERVYQRNQRRDFSEVAGGLAVLCVRRGFDHVEICAAGEQSTYLESIEFWYCGAGVSGSRDSRDAEHSMGELF